MNAHPLPRGCVPLLVAELVARQLDGFVQDSVNIPRIVGRVQLPGVPIRCSRALRVAPILERESEVSPYLRTALALSLIGGARSLPQYRRISAGAPVQRPECAERDGGGTHRSFH
jgi:hypothetical protein